MTGPAGPRGRLGGPGLFGFAALALVHRLRRGRPGSRAPRRPGRRASALRRGHRSAHGSRVAEQRRRGVDREVGGVDASSSSHADRERHRRARAACRGLYAATTVAPPTRVGVDEHLALAVVAHERGGGERRVEPLRRGRRSPASRRRSSSIAASRVDRHEDVHALGAARLHRAGEAGARRAPRARARPPRRRPRTRAPAGGSRSSTRWRRAVECAARQRRVVLDRALVGEPQQRPPVVAQRVGARRASTSRPTSATVATQSGVYFGRFFCMNGACPRPHPDHRQRPVAQHREDAVGDRVEVVDEVAAWSPRPRRTAARRGSSARRHAPQSEP